MGTGIVSVGLHLDHEALLADALLAVAVALWLGLFAIFVERALRQRQRWRAEAGAPGALTAVAGTAVLGSHLTLLGAEWAGYLLLVVALGLWLGLVTPVLRHWRTPTVGASFVLAVATESLAVLAALLATHDRVRWLAVAAVAPLTLGLAAYLFVLARIDVRQVLVGRGDHWIFGGALAIATLASARTSAALDATSTLGGLRPALPDVTLALWAAAALWLPALLAGELVAPRLGYDTNRWATVFPFGMYAVCSLAAGSVTGIGGLVSFGRVWIWVALAVWAIVFAGMLGRARVTATYADAK